MTLALTNGKSLHANEINVSIIAGLHVKHFNSSSYIDYRQAPTSSYCLDENRKTIWYEEYPLEEYNEGTNNNMLGVKLSYGQYAVTASKFDNSFNEDGHALAFSYDLIDSPEWELSVGPAILFGYRPALVFKDMSESMNKEIMPAVITNLGYKVIDLVKINYSVINHNTGMMTLELEF